MVKRGLLMKETSSEIYERHMCGQKANRSKGPQTACLLHEKCAMYIENETSFFRAIREGRG